MNPINPSLASFNVHGFRSMILETDDSGERTRLADNFRQALDASRRSDS